MRKKLVGKEVIFVKEATTTSGTDRGTLYLGKDMNTAENINEALISAGLVEVRRLNKPNEEEARLVALEEQAKSAGLGKWSKDSEASHVRDIKYTLENAKSFVDSHKQKPIDGKFSVDCILWNFHGHITTNMLAKKFTYSYLLTNFEIKKLSLSMSAMVQLFVLSCFHPCTT